MQNTLRIQILGALALGTMVALPVNAATETPKGPSSVSESAPDKTGKDAKGMSGTAVLPSKGPASANESAPQKTGKEPGTPMKADSKMMANPKTPASVSESAPDKAGKDGTGTKAYGKKTVEKEKMKESTAR